MTNVPNYASAAEAQKHFSRSESAKTRRALRFVQRHGSAPSKAWDESLAFYDLASTCSPNPNHVHPDCRRYNHLELNERGILLLSQLNAKVI